MATQEERRAVEALVTLAELVQDGKAQFADFAQVVGVLAHVFPDSAPIADVYRMVQDAVLAQFTPSGPQGSGQARA